MAAVRLQRFLSQAGVASRRSAETMIVAGRVAVNDTIVTELGTRVDPDSDRVAVDGQAIRVAATQWLVFHKPRGVLTTRSDPQGRPTIYDMLPPKYRRLFYVGRLDRDSEGLLLLTNDGTLAHRLQHPRWGIERIYDVRIRPAATAAELAQLQQGVELEDGPARVESVLERGRGNDGAARYRMVLREGRKREVRRLWEALGHEVLRLTRVAYGPVRLGELAPGAYRPLTRAEHAALSALTVERGPDA